MKKSTLFWTLLVAVVVSVLMIVAAQTNSGGAVASGGVAPASGGIAAEAAAPLMAEPENPDDVVIKLGDKEVTVAEFERRFDVAIRAVAQRQGAPLDAATLEQLGSLRPSFLDQYATQEVLLAEAEARDIGVTDGEVDTEFEAARTNAGENFDQLLTQAGYQSQDELRDFIRESLVLQKVVEALRGDIEVDDQTLRTIYSDNQERFAQGEQVCASHILVEDEAKANELYNELQGGADFAEVARANSTDPGSKDSGGDLGCFARGQMVAPFEEAAFAAEVNQVTEPVQSDFGYHLIRVSEKRPASTTAFADVRAQIEEEYVNEQVGREIETLRAESGIELYPEVLPGGVAATEQLPASGGAASGGGQSE